MLDNYDLIDWSDNVVYFVKGGKVWLLMHAPSYYIYCISHKQSACQLYFNTKYTNLFEYKLGKVVCMKYDNMHLRTQTNIFG